jgi:hypothetical protein
MVKELLTIGGKLFLQDFLNAFSKFGPAAQAKLGLLFEELFESL